MTGIIPKQATAAPWEDWNERIFNDCYNANCYSRYLDSDGRIISLTNNYEYISFNFGPTLLHWLDNAHPEMIDKLQQADRNSIARLGHGNAMAQGFNHTILALDDPKDAELQIEWGIRDFEYHFKREPEGMWLPECGVNERVIQLLADAKIKFIVLSPWQCNLVEDGNGNMVSLDGSPAPYNRSYILTGSNGGTVNAFFYHPGLAEGISFGHMLRSADNLYSSLVNIKAADNNPDLIHTATDGEIYGHHEPYGDMALAALIKKINERNDFTLDNYASFLEKHPSRLNAVLHKGEDEKGTSWSCSHGVSRWYKDCGCHTGGDDKWNQQWRTPLRNGLNNLGMKLNALFSEYIMKVMGENVSSQEILKKAGITFSGELSMSDFIKSLHSEYAFDEKEDVKLSHLLSGIKNKHFSFTSCGFFFSDISGIEPRQDIKYALYAISMFQPFCKEDLLLPFLSDLRMAKSNLKSQGDGMSIAQQEMKGLDGKIEAALYFYLNRSFADSSDFKDFYGRFKLLSYEDSNGNPYIMEEDTSSQEVFSFMILATSSECTGINLYISENNDNDKPIERFRITNSDIPERMIDETLIWIDKALSHIKYNELLKSSMHMQHFSMIAKNSKYTPMGTLILENLGLALKLIKSLFLNYSNLDPVERFSTLGNMIDFVRKYGRKSDLESINKTLSEYFENIAHEIKAKGLNDLMAEEIMTTLKLSRAHSFEPETKRLQEEIYPYYSGEKQASTEEQKLRDIYLPLNFK